MPQSLLTVPSISLQIGGEKFLSDLEGKACEVTDRAKRAMLKDTFQRGAPWYSIAREVDLRHHAQIELVGVTLGEMSNNSPELNDVIWKATDKMGLHLCPPAVGPFLALTGDSFGFERAIVISQPQVVDEGRPDYEHFMFQFGRNLRGLCLSLFADYVHRGFTFQNLTKVFGSGAAHEEQVFVFAREI